MHLVATHHKTKRRIKPCALQATCEKTPLNVCPEGRCSNSPYRLKHHNNVADDTVVVGLIANRDERAYGKDVGCEEVNVSKTKGLIVDFRKQQERNYTPH